MVVKLDLTQPRMKLARAQRIGDELRAAYEAFYSQEPFTTEMRDIDPGVSRSWHAVVRHQIPTSIALITGDFVHNLRATLDYLAWQLEIAQSRTPTEETHFPVLDVFGLRRGDKPPRSADQQQAYLAGWRQKGEVAFGKAAYDLVFDMQINVLERELSPLWMLHFLDIEDKHRLLNVVVGAVEFESITTIEGSVSFDSIEGIGRRHVPVVEGAELLRVSAAPGSEGVIWYRFEWFLAFGGDGPGKGQELLPTCGRLLHFVERSIDRFAELT